MLIRFFAFAAVAAFALISTSSQAADPAVKCESGKLKESAKYASCRLKAESKAVLVGGAPDFSKCVSKFTPKFNGLETSAGLGVCPSEMDEVSINARITADANDIAILLAGGSVPDCPADLATCNSDLADCGDDLTTCGSNLGACEALLGPLKTGQTICYDAAGAVIACAGTGQDGELQKGVARSFTDNGDGTITDNVTGLMWEKLSNDGSVHDKDNVFTWTNAFSSKLATLNAGFAGFTDWRVPNNFELETLRNMGVFGPAVYSAFNTICPAACTVLTCSCGNPTFHWSSTTFAGTTTHAWSVAFYEGVVTPFPKGSSTHVRAVRGGS